MKAQFLAALLLVLHACTQATPTRLQDESEEVVLRAVTVKEVGAADSWNDCPTACPRIFDPVCGSDGTARGYKYFHNECLMRYESCHSEKVWTQTQMSLCLEELEPFVRDECLRPCHFIYQPVCASDGKNFAVFGNDCVFGMENCFANGRWFETRHSDCGL